jgi:hypothetical protein
VHGSSDWSSDVCSSDLFPLTALERRGFQTVLKQPPYDLIGEGQHSAVGMVDDKRSAPKFWPNLKSMT